VTVQTIGSSSTVKPGGTVQFAITVWLTSGNGGTATVGVAASPTSVKPTFFVCQTTGTATCTVSGLKGGRRIETEAELTAASNLAGKDITLTVTATSHQASNTATATDKITVDATTTPSPTPTSNPPNGGNPGNPGTGGNLPPGTVPGVTNPGVSNPTGNLGSDFPQVSPSPNVAPTPSASHHQHSVEVTDLSAGLPLDVRLIGGQVVGLAILAAAITIAVARLSLRRQPARHSDDGSGSGS
jgi:hypothetical protein